MTITPNTNSFDLEEPIYGDWSESFIMSLIYYGPMVTAPKCTAGDGPILLGQMAKVFKPEDGTPVEFFHDDCAEDNGAYD